jgi:hypothetical protein
MSLAALRALRVVVHTLSICFSGFYFLLGVGAVGLVKGWNANSWALLISAFTWLPNALLAIRKPQLASQIQLFFCLPIFLLTLMSNDSPRRTGYARGVAYCLIFASSLTVLYSSSIEKKAKQQELRE